MRDLEASVHAALLAEAPDARIAVPGACPQANVDRDLTMLDAVLAGAGPARRLRIWTNPRCVVISKRLAARTSLALLRCRLRPFAAQLAVRASGGTAVVHRPGVVNVSLARLARPGDSIAEAYGELTGLLGRALRRLRLETGAGPAPGAYCDGDHNLLWQGRKLAGTAAVVRRRDGRTARLVHGSLVVWGDVREDIRLVQLAERDWLAPSTYVPAAHATVSEALHGPRHHLPSSRSDMGSEAGCGPLGVRTMSRRQAPLQIARDWRPPAAWGPGSVQNRIFTQSFGALSLAERGCRFR